MTVFDPLIGKQLGDYQIVEILGRGGMARVYKGYDARLDRYAAVKVIDASLLATENEDEYRQRFQREARAIAKLSHPNIVGIYQFGDYENLYYMAMVFIEGRDLGQLLKDRNTTLNNEQILRIVRGVGSALDYAHANGVIHRDVKPSNIMVTADYRAILTDFGLALSVPEGSIGNTFGSAHYIAPEQAISSADAVPQSDLYALGVVLYQMLAGKVPFDDPSAMAVALKHLNENPPPLSRFNPKISSRVEAVVLRAIEKQPENRFSNGAAFTNALEAAFSEQPPLTAPEIPRFENEGTTIAVTDSNSSGSAAPVYKGEEHDVSRSNGMPQGQPEPVIQPAPPKAGASLTRAGCLRWGLVALALLVLGGIGILAVNGGILSQNGGADSATAVSALASPTTAATTVAASATATATATMEATDEATPMPTARPSATATERLPTATLTEPPVVPSATPEPSIIPSATPQLDGSVLLIYDNNSIVLLNQSDQAVDAGGLNFIQPAQNLSYDSVDWANGSEVIYSLPAGGCVQLWQLDLPEIPPPENCASRYAWRAVSPMYWFWISPQANAVFEVWRDDELLATCVISAGACSFTP